MNNNKDKISITKGKVKKIIGYCRVSTDNQKDERTIEIQERALSEYAKANKYDLVEIFKDEGVSGGLENRPALVELFDYIEGHKDIYGVLIYKLDIFYTLCRLLFQNGTKSGIVRL